MRMMKLNKTAFVTVLLYLIRLPFTVWVPSSATAFITIANLFSLFLLLGILFENESMISRSKVPLVIFDKKFWFFFLEHSISHWIILSFFFAQCLHLSMYRKVTVLTIPSVDTTIQIFYVNSMIGWFRNKFSLIVNFSVMRSSVLMLAIGCFFFLLLLSSATYSTFLLLWSSPYRLYCFSSSMNTANFFFIHLNRIWVLCGFYFTRFL